MSKPIIAKKMATCFALMAGAASFALGQHAHVSSELGNVAPGNRVNVIVRFRNPVGAAQHQMVRDLGGAVGRSLASIRAGVYSVSGAALPILADNPEVLSVSPDRPVHMLLDNTTAAVNASVAWNLGWDGRGVG